MKILVVSNFFPPHFVGGAEIVAFQLAQALAARGHSVRVFAGDASRNQPGYDTTDDLHEGLPVRRVALTHKDFQAGGNDVAHPEVDALFGELLDTWRPDLVHAHHLLGLSLGIVRSAHARGVPVYMTLHDHWGFCFNSTRITSAGQLCHDTSRCATDCRAFITAGEQPLPLSFRQDYIRWQLQAVTAFILPSHYLANTYRAAGLPTDRVHVIPNGIDLQRFSHPAPAPRSAGTEARLRILFIGYMGPHKGVPQLLEALARLPGRRLQVDFVGAGHALSDYRRALAASAPAVSAKFWGRLPNADVAHRLAQADVLVLPSVCPENQPVSITEAMACGLPVVASRIGGIPELVEHQVTGLLATAGDAAALAACLQHYLDHPAQLAAHGAAARARIQAFALSAQVDQLEALFAAPVPPPPAALAVACHGRPHASTFDHVRRAFDAPPFAALGKPGAPAWVPAQWLAPQQAGLLWVADAPGRQAALARIKAYRAAAKPVLLDERNVRLLRQLDGAVLICRGAHEHALAFKALLGPIPIISSPTLVP